MNTSKLLALLLLLLLFLVLQVLEFTICESKDTITINQTLRDGEIIVSENRNFALGFFSPGSSTKRYVGIWFYKVSQQTVIWVANRNAPINHTSGILIIGQKGNLVLVSSHVPDQRFPVWSSNVSALEQRGHCEARLLDSGNFVLLCDDQIKRKMVVWQSFDYPTDTALQEMKLGLDRKTGLKWTLTSWRSKDDPGTGDYSFEVSTSGSPQFFLYDGNKYYWRTEPWPWGMYADIYNYTFVNDQDGLYVTYFLRDASIIIRLVLDESGYLKRFIWHEKEGKWKEFWSAPKYRCESYGWCGPYGKCETVRVNSFECSCLPGYEPKLVWEWELRDGSSGCVRKRAESSPMCGNGEGFVKLEEVKLPDTSKAVWVSMNMSHLECEVACRSDCSCTAYASPGLNENKGTGCLTWYGELVDVIEFSAGAGTVYIRVDAQELAEIARKSNSFLRNMGMFRNLAVSIILAWAVVIVFAYLWFTNRKKRAKNQRKKKLLDRRLDKYDYEDSLASSSQDLVYFDLAEILAATDRFSPENKLGQGGFGVVYKGRLFDTQEIAVKRLSMDSGQGTEEFKNEVRLIAKLQHRNLVKLLGCCIQGKEKMLVYEYLPNKSLDLLLFDETGRSLLNWRKRFDIIVGIARGILYLHQDSRLRIIHRDLKTSNILLDADMNPKISDFGMARALNGDQVQDKTKRVVGTYGYMSPEYAVFGRFSVKSDVFSFGVILLEIVSGKKNSGFCQQDPSLSLVGHVWEQWREEKTLEMEAIDSSMKSLIPQEAIRCIQIGLLCVQEDPVDRPTMLSVLLMLNSDASIPSPNPPAYIFKQSFKKSSKPIISETPQHYSVNDLTLTEVLTR